ncbi:MAG: ATP-binding protein [Burkholderiaceae bacterium]|nr:ATP-binding protein [Burkholderiaceae bacterium]
MSATHGPEGTPVGATGHRGALAQAMAALVSGLRDHEWPVTPPPEPPRLAALGPLLGLSTFERALLLLCATAALEPALTQALTRQGASHPSWALALRALADGHWDALTPEAPLRRWRLVEPAGDGDWLQQRLRLDERLLHHLLGIDPLDERLQPQVRALLAPAMLPASRRDAAQRLAPALRDAATAPCVHLAGSDAEDALDLAAAACAAAGLRLYACDAADLPEALEARREFARRWSREALLAGRALAITGLDAEHPRRAAAVALAGDTLGAVFLPGDDAVVSGLPALRPLQRLPCPPLSPQERRTVWRESLAAAAPDDSSLQAVARQFQLGAAGVRRAAAEVLRTADAGTSATRLWDAARQATRPRLGMLAQVIEPQAGWDDLVLPPRETAALRAIAAFVRQRHRVYDDWGFADRQSRGLGIAALFAGVSGTGKTLAAEVLAAALRLDLYRIDLSAVVSKYIGETEKHLRVIFDAADQGGAVLLFDEADALFGKRSEVRDSHDRYANIEVSYLLQRMEAYRGLAILTTNQRSALDEAFARRLRFVVEFPFPGAEERARIWQRTLPARLPLRGVDVGRLARLNLAGGHIRNIALGAAALAADGDEPLGMQHLLAATRTEYSKLERPLSATETQGWT